MPRFNRKLSVARTEVTLAKAAVVLEPQRGKLTSPSRAKSAVVFEPQRGDPTKPRPTAWVNGTPINHEP